MLSPKEEQMVAEYDKSTEEQIIQDRDYKLRPTKKISLDLLFEALEYEALNNIKEANSEICVMVRCKERFITGPIKDLVNYFITLAQYQIEDEYDNISRWRTEKESCRIRGCR